MQHNLQIYNTLSGSKEAFKPLNAPHVGMYVCGPTVYNDVHLGNCRTFISFDLVFRYLSHLGYKVRYVRNITDAGHLENDADAGEDKISQRARLEQLEPMEIVQKYTVGFRHVMGLFNALPPSIEPTATGHIVEQIEMIKVILVSGLAYEVNGSVYFDVEKYNKDHRYGVVSGRNIDELLSGTRDLDGQEEKKSPLDFALWKKASPTHIQRWPSPWGEGFPGWHLECSAMSTKYLGETFDIHGGGMDLKFPHHECEVAQNTAHHGSGGPKVWMHANMLTLNGKRMSKSTGNTLLPLELFTGNNTILSKGFAPSVVRFFILQAHYRSTLDFSNDALLAAEKGYLRMMEAWKNAKSLTPGKANDLDLMAWETACYAAMDDDFNSPMLISKLFEVVPRINAAAEGKESFSQEQLDLLNTALKTWLFDVLGLEESGAEGTGELTGKLVDLILEMRIEARKGKDWATSDKLRDALLELGVVVKDGKDGSTYTLP